MSGHNSPPVAGEIIPADDQDILRNLPVGSVVKNTQGIVARIAAEVWAVDGRILPTRNVTLPAEIMSTPGESR